MFKVENLTNNNNEPQHRNGNKMIKNNENPEIDKILNENKIIKTNKKDKNQQINHIQNDNILNVKKQKNDASQNKNKIINNVTKSLKRKIDRVQNGSKKKQKFLSKKHKPNNKEASVLETMTDDRLKAYGINPKKFRNKLKFGKN